MLIVSSSKFFFIKLRKFLLLYFTVKQIFVFFFGYSALKLLTPVWGILPFWGTGVREILPCSMESQMPTAQFLSVLIARVGSHDLRQGHMTRLSQSDAWGLCRLKEAEPAKNPSRDRGGSSHILFLRQQEG